MGNAESTKSRLVVGRVSASRGTVLFIICITTRSIHLTFLPIDVTIACITRLIQGEF